MIYVIKLQSAVLSAFGRIIVMITIIFQQQQQKINQQTKVYYSKNQITTSGWLNKRSKMSGEIPDAGNKKEWY